jgi:hypothetical protein
VSEPEGAAAQFVRDVPVVGTVDSDLTPLGHKGASVVALARHRLPQPPSVIIANDALQRLVAGSPEEREAMAQAIVAHTRPLVAEARHRVLAQDLPDSDLLDHTGLIVRGSPRTHRRGVALSLRNIDVVALGAEADAPRAEDEISIVEAVRVNALNNVEHSDAAPQHGAHPYGSVIVQSLVPFNAHRGGSGVVYSRDPNVGGGSGFGDFVRGVTGRALTLGRAPVVPYESFAAEHPDANDALADGLAALEAAWRTVVEFEFVFTGAHVLVVQAGRAAMTPLATVRNALALWRDGVIAAADVAAMVTDEVLEAARATELLESGGDLAVHARAGAAGIAEGAVTPDPARDGADPPRWVVGDPHAPEALLRSHGGVAGHGPADARRAGLPLVVGIEPALIERLLAATGGRAVVDGLQGLVAAPGAPRRLIDLAEEEAALAAAVADPEPASSA